MFWVSNRYAKLWKVFRETDKYVDCSVGTSEKKQDGTYENSSWNARLIGKALNQYKKGDLEEGEQYAIRGKLTNVRYQDENGDWRDSYRLIVLETGPAGEDIDPDAEQGKPAKKTQEKKPAAKKPAAKRPMSQTAPQDDDEDEEDGPW